MAYHGVKANIKPLKNKRPSDEIILSSHSPKSRINNQKYDDDTRMKVISQKNIGQRAMA